MFERTTMFIDKERCIGCYACVVACKLEHDLPPYPTSPPVGEPKGPNLIQVYRVGPEIREGRVYQYFLPIACKHCSDAPCIKACPTAALPRSPKYSIVTVDRDECIGCVFCLEACPWGAPQFDQEGKAMLCDLCIHRLEEGKQTACEAACVARAIYVGTPAEISVKIGKKAAERAGMVESERP